MKKITLLSLLTLSSFTAIFAQQKSTGNVSLSSNMTANLTLNNTTSKAILQLTGPSDRWFALQFGNFGPAGGMQAGSDFVFANQTTLVDANHNGYAQFPNTDASQNWTVTTNTVATGVRTIIAERAFSTGDANDFTFTYANATIDFAWARSAAASYGLSNHGPSNRGYNTSVPLSTTLGVDDFSLQSALLFPNPSNGQFTVQSPLGLNQINIYSLTGALVQSIAVNETNTRTEVSLSHLQKGMYLVELQKDDATSWKKIIIQ